MYSMIHYYVSFLALADDAQTDDAQVLHVLYYVPVYPSWHWQLNAPLAAVLQVRAKFLSLLGHWQGVHGSPCTGSP